MTIINENSSPEETTIDPNAVIAQLASLSDVEYDQQRKGAASQLGIRIETLDGAVKSARQSDSKQGASETSQGQGVMFPDVEPWPEPVDGATLLDELVDTFNRYTVLPKHGDTVLALWIPFTWMIDSVDVAPILALSSPEKQCGKTTTLTLVNNLSARPLPSANISPASLFRAIELWQPTMLIDEADTFLRGSDDLRGILNSGHTRQSAFVLRSVGDDHEPKQFSTWGAKAIALIGGLPETLHDRSVVLELRRKLVGEVTEKLRHAEESMFMVLRSKLQRFSQDNMKKLRSIRPELPDTISDRAADNWDPLLAIATLAGDQWIERALEAAKSLSSREEGAASLGTELLTDIEGIFAGHNADKISSADLIGELCVDEERPWAGRNRGFPIKPYQVAKMLKEYGISSKTIRIGNSTPKGYEVAQFEDAFSRYLHGGEETAATTQQAEVNGAASSKCGGVADTEVLPWELEEDISDEEMERIVSESAKVVSSHGLEDDEDDGLPF